MTISAPVLCVTPVRPGIKSKDATPVDFVVRIQTPEAPPVSFKRPSVNLALAIDCSGSMLGRPLEEAKRAAIAMVNGLDDSDRVAVIAYDSAIEVVLESMLAKEAKKILADRLETIHKGGGTALHEGWLRAAEAAAPFVSSYGVTRVILLSDGNPNIGKQNPDELAEESMRLAASGVGTSTYGLGFHFNEALMTKLAQEGQASYAATADELLPYFETEFTIMASTLGRQVKVSIHAKTSSGQAVTVTNLNGFALTPSGWSLPNLLAGAETWAAFDLAVPEMKAGESVILESTATWVDMSGQSQSSTHTVTLKVQAKSSKKEDVWAVERVREARAALLQREAVEKARHGDVMGAQSALRSMAAMSCNNAYISHVSETLSGALASGDMNLFLKEGTYGAKAMSSRVTSTHEDASLMASDRYGLRKAFQGTASKPTTETAK